MEIDHDALKEAAINENPLDFKTSLKGSLNQHLSEIKEKLNTEVSKNVMDGGEINNYEEIVGIKIDEPKTKNDDEKPPVVLELFKKK